MNIGKIVQVMGPVVDVEFDGVLPSLKDALYVESGLLWRLLSRSAIIL